VKDPFRSSSQAAICYYQSNRAKVEAIPLRALPKDSPSELGGLSLHYPFPMLNVKQGNCENQLLKSFGLTWPGNRAQVYRLRGERSKHAPLLTFFFAEYILLYTVNYLSKTCFFLNYINLFDIIVRTGEPERPKPHDLAGGGAGAILFFFRSRSTLKN